MNTSFLHYAWQCPNCFSLKYESFPTGYGLVWLVTILMKENLWGGEHQNWRNNWTSKFVSNLLPHTTCKSQLKLHQWKDHLIMFLCGHNALLRNKFYYFHNYKYFSSSCSFEGLQYVWTSQYLSLHIVHTKHKLSRQIPDKIFFCSIIRHIGCFLVVTTQDISSCTGK
jgi:hypothetical protein